MKKRRMILHRGGSWYVYPGDLRSAHRHWYHPTFTLVDVGFRVALVRKSSDRREEK